MNGADGVSDIEGKAARVAASECGQRASFKEERAAVSPLGLFLPVMKVRHQPLGQLIEFFVR